MRLRVGRPGPLSTIQDSGRRGYESLGIGIGGVLDDYAAAWANRLVQNARDAAVLEMTLSGPELEVEEGGRMALAGADMAARVNGRPWSPGSAVRLEPGDVLRFGVAARGLRGYLAVAGGFAADLWLESRSTDLLVGRGGMGGRALRAGDVLEADFARPACDNRPLLRAAVATVEPRGPIRILAGDDTSAASLAAPAFHVAPRADRVGIRLLEPVPALRADAAARGAAGGTGLSEGMAMGSVEVTPGGEVIVLMKARGTVGGYFVPAHVISADWPRLAQLRPGGAVQFAGVTEAEAAALRARLRARLSRPMVAGEGVPTAVESPSPGTARRALAVGHVVSAGEWVGEVDGTGGTEALYAPVSGTVRYAAPDGALLEEGDPVVWIEGGPGRERGADDGTRRGHQQ